MIKIKYSSKFLLVLFFMLANTLSFADIVPYDSDLIEKNYASSIDKHRVQEGKSFLDKKTTLLSKEFFPRFTGLNYFPVDLKYRIVGALTRLPKAERKDLVMSSGGSYGFVHYGHVNFYLDGKETELQAYEFPTRDSKASAIFVPFTDDTTGEDSYGGGRFMIINIPSAEQIVLDFNLAINPICVYDPEHACPVPPRSNRLKSSVQAGAKMYHDPVDGYKG